MINDIMSINEKIVKLAEIKEENPDEFERIVKENIKKNESFNNMLNSVPLEKAIEQGSLTWLDKLLMKEEELDEKEVRGMHPAEKVELYLRQFGIVGYGNDAIRAVAAAYGVNLNI